MVYLLLTDGFEEIEAFTPVDILRRCGIELLTVGVREKAVIGAHNIKTEADIEISEVNKELMEMLILPGGPGYAGLKTPEVYELINYTVQNNIPVGAICAAPSVLGETGLLENKKATCFPGFENEMKGANLTGEGVAEDGIFITGKGAGAASDFAFALASRICGAEKAREIKDAMQY